MLGGLMSRWLQWVFRFRGVLAACPLIVAAVTFRMETERHRLLWSAALALVGLGIALRTWAQQHLHHRLSVPLQLTRTGPYALIRNPLYVGNTLICVGATFASELLWMVPVAFLWCLVLYALVVRYEESVLLARYGDDYRRFADLVPRWIPRKLTWRNAAFVNEYLWPSLRVEMRSLLVLVPFAAKELYSHWLGH